MNEQQVFPDGSERKPDDIWLGPYASVMYHSKKLGFKDPWIISKASDLDGHKPTVRLHLCMGLKHIIYDSHTIEKDESIQSIGCKALRSLASGQDRNGLLRVDHKPEESIDGQAREGKPLLRRALDWLGE